MFARRLLRNAKLWLPKGSYTQKVAAVRRNLHFAARKTAHYSPNTGVMMIMGIAAAAGVAVATADDASAQWDDRLAVHKRNLKELQSAEALFQRVATGEGADAYVTADAFLRAALSSRFTFASEEQIAAVCGAIELPLLGDEHGRIYLEEFTLLLELLRTPMEHTNLAFQLVDLDHSQEIDAAEFKAFVAKLTDTDMKKLKLRNKRFADHFFGKDGQGSMSFNQFHDFVVSLKRAPLLAEFTLYSGAERPVAQRTVSSDKFALMLLSPCKPSTIHSLADRMESIRRERPEHISFEDAWKMHLLLTEQKDDLMYALSIFCKGGNREIRTRDLQHAAKVVANVPLSHPAIAVLLSVFDRDGDGSLDYGELEYAIRQRELAHRDEQAPTWERVKSCIAETNRT